MKVVTEYKLDWELYYGRKYPIYIIPCPECGYKNAELYPVKLIICRKCQKIFPVHGKIFAEIQNIADKFGDITQHIGAWEWDAIRKRFEKKYNRTE